MRNLTLDQSRLLLSVLVVLNHSAFLKDHSLPWNYFITQAAFRFSVPAFLVIGGYFFYKYLNKGGSFRRWFLDLLILHSFWSVVYLYFYYPENASLDETLIEIGKKFIEGYWHLWFTMAMLGAAFCLYFLKCLSDRWLVLLSLALFLIGAVVQYSGNYHIFSGSYLDTLFNKTHIYRNFLFIGLPFLTLGYLISKNRIEELITAKSCALLFVITFLLLLMEGAVNLFHIGDFRQTFDILISQYLLAPSLVLLLLKSERKTNSKLYGELSAGVYFIHPFFLLILMRTLTNNALLFLATMICSIAAAYVLVKINRRVGFIL